MSQDNSKDSLSRLKGKVVLNVDDNELNQLVISKIMENAGLKIINVSNGAEAVEKLTEGLNPDIVVLDLEMPVMNGVETAGFIRNKILSSVPIIINSGFVSTFDRWKLTRMGIKDFLEKPYSMKDIFSKLLKNISLQQA